MNKRILLTLPILALGLAGLAACNDKDQPVTPATVYVPVPSASATVVPVPSTSKSVEVVPSESVSVSASPVDTRDNEVPSVHRKG